MKKKLTRNELKNVFGGSYLVPALECYSNGQCAKYCEALVECNDGTTSMTNYFCMGGICMLNTGFCPPEPVLQPII